MKYYQKYHPSILVVTHQKTLLDSLKPSVVHVLDHKKIVQSGDIQLAQMIFNEGFHGASIIDGRDENE